MKFYSTNKKSDPVSFKEAVIRGIAPDGGLFMPEKIPSLPVDFIKHISNYELKEIAFEVAKSFLSEDINDAGLQSIVNKAITFDSPVSMIDERTGILELFCGPTLAFKDFGARFMAETVSYLNRSSKEEITILVATSGDTGSAVANGFFNVDGVKVVLLYPSGKVSEIQEKQLTTMGSNITALEVDGTFDDCQRLVKTAFPDKDISGKVKLSSANSINIARLLPQSFYNFRGYAQLNEKNKPLFVSVPSGNFGNLTAGLIAKRMGLPVAKFIAAVNSNDVFLKYIKTGIFKAEPSVQTLSNAMDVGNPSNFARIMDLYGGDHQKITTDIYSAGFNDEQTKEAITDVYNNYNYVIDPHGAVGYLALQQFLNECKVSEYNSLILETAHPAKFLETVENVIGSEIEMPERLKRCLNKEKRSVKISNKFKDLKDYLLRNK